MRKITTATDILTKELLINILQRKLNWSHSQLASFTEESLKDIYEYILAGYLVTKAKTRDSFYNVEMRIPNSVFEYLGCAKGDWFDILINIHRKEVVLDRDRKNRIKLRPQNKINLPYKLIEKNLLKPNDDTMIVVKRNKIILKSFSYLQ